MNDVLLWQARHFVYNHFADTAYPPSVGGTARHLNISTEEASGLYRELHNRHALFLEPGTLTIRMANPFSGIPTDFKVFANGKTYFANCAWDMLGIPAALQSDAIIEAVCTESNDRVQLEVRAGQIQARAGACPDGSSVVHRVEGSPGGDGQSNLADDLKIHYLVPFARWYDDLVFT